MPDLGDGTAAPTPSRRTRDRRGRGMRGPARRARAIRGRPALRTRRERFDQLVLDIVHRDRRALAASTSAWSSTPSRTPRWCPTTGATTTVPLSSLVRGTGQQPTRLVLFRRPIEHRCEGRDELEAMVLTVVVEQVAELLGLHARGGRPAVRRLSRD